MGRTDEVVRNNSNNINNVGQALKALRTLVPDLLVDDLHAHVDAYCGVNYKQCDLQLPANVHFEAKGCLFLAKYVIQSVLEALGQCPFFFFSSPEVIQFRCRY